MALDGLTTHISAHHRQIIQHIDHMRIIFTMNLCIHIVRGAQTYSCLGKISSLKQKFSVTEIGNVRDK